MSTEEKPETPSRNFLTRLYAELKTVDELSLDAFQSAVRKARAHAGGKAKAEKSKTMAESLTDFIDKVQNALWQSFRSRMGEAEFSYAREVYTDHVIACSSFDGKDYQIPFSIVNDEISFGDPVEVETQYVVVGAHEIADLCADGRGVKLFMEQNFADVPEWINYLPKPGKYTSPRYGEIVITKERNENFIANFQNKVYQEKLPIDCEHDVDASGAVAWIVDMRLNADESVDAKPEWNDRGKSLIEADRFKYFSPSWFSVWTDPVDPDKQIHDVAIGGALTTRPFFKEKALRPLVANERGISELQGNVENLKSESSVLVLNFTALSPVENSEGVDMAENKTGDEPNVVDPQKFAEVQTQLSEAQGKVTAAEAKLVETEAALKASEEAATKASERITALERDARSKRFTETAKGWIGETVKHVALLEHFATQEGGEDSDLFKSYVVQQDAAAEQIKNGKLFTELGSSAPAEGSAKAVIAGQVKQFRESDPKLTEEMAFDKAWENAPATLREQYRDEERRTVN